MEHIRWVAQPKLRNPVVVAAFTGWNDAADAASMAVRAMIEGWNAEPLGTIDPEEFTDFAVARPHVRFDAAGRREIVWPQTSLWYASLPGADVVLVLGPEPSMRWRTFTQQIIDVAVQYESSLVVTLGALLADVAHSRAVPVMGTATDEDLQQRFDLQTSQYEGPTGIVGTLVSRCADVDVSALSFWAATPAYASSVDSPKAALALVKRVSQVIGAPPPTAELAAAAESYAAQVDALISDNDDLVGYVRRLELAGDDEIDTVTSSAPEPSGDDLIEELERFLRDQ